jgi:uncharacterized protein DUF6152
MKLRRIESVLILGLLLAAPPVLAHHSFAAQYDETSLIALTGKVTKVTWKNPHVILNVDVTEDDGLVANWQIELGSPNGLLQQGWKVDSLKPGDQVTVSGFRAKDGSRAANARKVVVGAQGKVYSAPGDGRARK